MGQAGHSRQVRFRPRAWEDVQESVSYLAADASGEVAEHFLDAVIELTERLAKLPRMGTLCHFANPQLRGLRWLRVTGFERWLVFYQAPGGEIEIIRVLHGARDVASILDPNG